MSFRYLLIKISVSFSLWIVAKFLIQTPFLIAMSKRPGIHLINRWHFYFICFIICTWRTIRTACFL